MMQDHVHEAATAGSQGGSSFLPHGFCYLWEPGLLWSHVVADMLIGLSYVAISLTLVWFVWRGRREFPFQWMFLSFGTFIVACGATHFMGVWNLWNPDYWASAGLKALTAAASVGTAILLPPMVPRALATIRAANLSEQRRLLAEQAEALRDSEERFRVTFEQAAVGMAHVALDGAWIRVNDRLCEITGYSRHELLERTFQEMTHPADLDTDVAQAERLRSGDIGSYSMEKRYIRRDGATVWVNLTVSLVRSATGEPHHYIAIVEDIDARHRAEQELRTAKARAEEANRSKDQFLAVMSHELRTPLNAVIGYSDLLSMGVKGELNGPQAESVHRITRSSRHLLGLIDQVLLFTRNSHEPPRPRAERVRIADLLEEATAVVEPFADEQGLELSIRDRSDGRAVLTDASMLRQILLNLLSNALKYTDAGVVSVEATLDGHWLVLDVADTGIGIEPEQLGRIFEPFFQADASLTRRRGGSGLGLSVVRQLVAAMDGTVKAESRPGRGSRFRVRVPVSAAPEEVPVPATRARPA